MPHHYLAGVADTFIEAPAEPSNERNQIFAAIVLGIAATLTAVAAYNAALTDGDALGAEYTAFSVGSAAGT